MTLTPNTSSSKSTIVTKGARSTPKPGMIVYIVCDYGTDAFYCSHPILEPFSGFYKNAKFLSPSVVSEMKSMLDDLESENDSKFRDMDEGDDNAGTMADFAQCMGIPAKKGHAVNGCVSVTPPF